MKKNSKNNNSSASDIDVNFVNAEQERNESQK